MRGGDDNVEGMVDEVQPEMTGGGKKLKGRGAHEGGKRKCPRHCRRHTRRTRRALRKSLKHHKKSLKHHKKSMKHHKKSLKHHKKSSKRKSRKGGQRAQSRAELRNRAINNFGIDSWLF
jgi:hypothetical protein